MSVCKSCGARIVWAVTEIERRGIPVDEQTNMAGNLIFVADGNAVRVVPPGQGKYISHFATCPNAKKHRKPKP